MKSTASPLIRPMRFLIPTLLVATFTVIALWANPWPAAAQTAAPYVFFLFDTSGSMTYSPPCTASQITAGDCGFLCPTGDCFVPLNGDDPASKLYQLKKGLYTSIAGRADLLYGFGSFNQNILSVRAKHWIYQAVSNGPSIPGWGPYPAVGAQEVFGLSWACNSGTFADDKTGCSSTFPADLNDGWELARVQRLPKWGLVPPGTTVDVFVRYAGIVYKAHYVPYAGALGVSVVQTNVTLYRCTNTPCTASTAIGSAIVGWVPVSEFVSYDVGQGRASRTNPFFSYFPLVADDTSSSGSCSGWDPNNDSGMDSSMGHSLRWPTNSTDPRGSSFWQGDVIPLDWLNGHQLDLEQRLAPNLALSPTAAPDFRVSPYLKDNRQVAEAFLRLKNESARPLIADGGSSQGAFNVLSSFAGWYSGWQTTAALQDPDWSARHTALVLLTDENDDFCGGDACAQASTLASLYGVKTFVLAFGAQPTPGGTLECVAANGGTGTPFYPQTVQELVDDLNLIYTAAANP